MHSTEVKQIYPQTGKVNEVNHSADTNIFYESIKLSPATGKHVYDRFKLSGSVRVEAPHSVLLTLARANCVLGSETITISDVFISSDIALSRFKPTPFD